MTKHLLGAFKINFEPPEGRISEFKARLIAIIQSEGAKNKKKKLKNKRTSETYTVTLIVPIYANWNS